ncbi:WXG100 family type VII secretion target [Streptomyces sp. NPDC059989]|uniref:WXG100 family type VII secretion target n=1 Tax=Streptomyces sp. NPDC059989 TaxID=3347026 RepID=UPI0036CAB8AE
MVATTFDGYSHQQLRAMIASLDPIAVKDRADRLEKASEDIRKIAEKLKNHRVTGWEGAGATAFQEWVGRAGNATLRLSDYSATGSKWMADTVQMMTEAQKMPGYDTGAAKNLEAARKAHNDPDAPKVAKEAEATLEADHREAVRLMNNLAQKYEQSSTEMNKAEIPTFPPPPETFVPKERFESEDMARPGGGAAGSAGSSHVTPSGPGERQSNEPGWVPGHPPQADTTPPRTTGSPTLPVPGIPDHNVDLGLDHVATLPPPTTLPATGTPVPQVPVGPGGPSPVLPIPPVSLPPISGPKPGIGPGGPGPLQGLSGPNNGLGKVGQVAGLPPRDNGIMGGRQVPTSGPSSSIPRGTVIGTEGTQTGRAMGGTQAGRGMGGMMGGGMGGGAHGGVGGSPVGRRLASEPGGIVGGRQSAAGAKGGQPFTQGGSGLVRNTAGGTGAGAHTPNRRREDQGGERPDYLAEDEETWQGNRRVVPPVID